MSTNLFSLETYYQCLKTSRLGRPCLYLDTVSSTIDVIPREKPNTLILAKEQTRGRGQRTNVWQSLVGCAMGSVRLQCAKDSLLAKRVCFLQHILALSAARTLERIDPYRLGRDQIGLKWPNDIIYKKDKLKIGGVLVNTQDLGELYDITLSFGLNVDNREPTTCVNEIIKPTGKRVTIDSVVAGIMNNLEEYTDELNEDRFEQIKVDYERRCMQIGKIVLDEKAGTVKVTGVNEDGFLIGECETSRKPRTVMRII
uniref:Biotin--protein ligase n=1 Tax=Aceria tosichella TaxID=561515 RepID=A0A6G1S7Q7_9ACAR